MVVKTRLVAFGTSAVVSLLAVSGLWLINRDAGNDPVAPIVNTPQTYDGEHIDKLTALGVDGIPHIGKALLGDPEFPVVFVYAFGNIGDPSATKYLLEFIKRREPWSNSDESTLDGTAIEGLIGVGGTDAIPDMISIYTADSTHPRVRLAASSVVAALAEGDEKDAAIKFISELRENRRAYFYPNAGFARSELEEAIYVQIGGLWLNQRQRRNDPVPRIVYTDQTYEGEHVDNLTALGVDGIPYMGRALLRGPEFPLLFVDAFKNIGDPSATKYLLEFIRRREPWTTPEYSTENARAIGGLIALNGRDAVPDMISLYRDETPHVRVRLAAAALVAALADGEEQAAANEFISELNENRRAYFHPDDGFTPPEIEAAMNYVRD